MQVSSCLSPILVYNKYSRQYVQVPCGHCDACLNLRYKSWSDRLQREFIEFKHVYFITLTYSDPWLPMYSVYNDSPLLHPVDVDKNNSPRSLCLEYEDLLSLWNQSLNHPLVDTAYCHYGCIPVLSHNDISLFCKSLKNLNCSNYGKSRFYAVGEYGGNFGRPHYHVLWFSSVCYDFEEFQLSVCNSWSSERGYSSVGRYFSFPPTSQLGRIDVQYCDKKSGLARYVTTYCCRSISLDRLRSTVFPQFHTQSRGVIGYYNDHIESDAEIFYRNLSQVTIVSPKDSSITSVRLPLRIANRLFPTLDGNRSKYGSYYNRQTASLAMTSTVYSSYDQVMSDDCPLSYIIRDFLSDYDYDYDKLVQHFSKLKSWSKRVMSLTRLFHCSVYDVLYHIDCYISNLELMKLREFYIFQQQLVGDIQIKNMPIKKYDASQLLALYQLCDPHTGCMVSDSSLLSFGISPNDYQKVVSCFDKSHFSEFNDYVRKQKKIALDGDKSKHRNNNFINF